MSSERELCDRPETNKPIARVADDLGVNPGTLGNWVNQDRANRGDADATGLIDLSEHTS